MNIVIRKRDYHAAPHVVVEVWMTPTEVKAHAHRSPALEAAIDDLLPEHVRTGTMVRKEVKTGGHP